ncbi:uncharacterized protein LOC125235836 [Leguminivora glycinivorella]|uniref:uncharacterized protein LOC125235836 n=1 Tax=Leguminivora glycinivorella TaxID=1035111 RepID=UPI0020104A34|nr:uncharacterized protein LOC125235836 [Leguminivora glycinivorella]
MRLAIVLVILAFCYCGSYADVNRCICLQPGDMDPQIEGHINPFQPRPRRDEAGIQFSEDPEIAESKKKENSGKYSKLRVGFGSPPPIRSRRVPKSQVLHILPEYIKEEPQYVYGDYDIQG